MRSKIRQYVRIFGNIRRPLVYLLQSFKSYCINIFSVGRDSVGFKEKKLDDGRVSTKPVKQSNVGTLKGSGKMSRTTLDTRSTVCELIGIIIAYGESSLVAPLMIVFLPSRHGTRNHI